MAWFDLPRSQLESYRSAALEPSDFDAFWADTLAQARRHPLDATFHPADFALAAVECFDVTFSGYGGQRIKGWLMLPQARSRPLPAIVTYVGYGGGRGTPWDVLNWSAVGMAHLVMDTRGQGGAWLKGDTPDICDTPAATDPQHPGFMTRGILSPESYYYRRLYTDAVRAVEVLRDHPAVDGARLAVGGGSQGGGLALAVAGLSPALLEDGVKLAFIDVPFLCDFQRALELVDTNPYGEITRFLKVQRDKVAQALNTLNYIDGVHFAPRATALALFSVGLMDDICPPSTVYAAANAYGGPHEVRVWEYNNHEGGGAFQFGEQVALLRSLGWLPT
jgi:cephalosporin-C deacetylase